MVDDADSPLGLPDKLQRLIHVLHLVVMRMRRAVRCHQSVDAERPVVRLVAEVATIKESPPYGPRGGFITMRQNTCVPLGGRKGGQSLVHPVPDGGTGDAAVVIDDVPVLLQITHRVTHGVGIFAGNERLLRFLLSLGLQHSGCGVAEVVQGGIARMTVVEGQSRGVQTAHRVIHRLYVGAYTTLVA